MDQLDFADFMAYDMLKNSLPDEITMDLNTLKSTGTCIAASPCHTITNVDISSSPGDIFSAEVTSFSPSAASFQTMASNNKMGIL